MLLNILLIEDNESDVVMIKFLVKQLGHHLDVVGNAMDAQEKIKNYNYNLILLDWQLPQISGLDFLKSIKKDVLKKNIPVIMMSGRNELKHIQMAVKEGVNDYIVKPVDPLIFKNKISQLTLKIKIENWTLSDLPADFEKKSGYVLSPLTLTALSEFEFHFEGNSLLAINTIYDVSFELLQELEIGQIQLKISEVIKKDDESGYKFIAFPVGLKEEQLKKIRLISRTFYTQEKEKEKAKGKVADV